MLHVQPFWHPDPSRQQDSYVAFQATLNIRNKERVELHLFGCDMYRVYLAEEEVWEGPARFAAGHPLYDVCEFELPEGEHALTILVHYYGVATRITSNQLPAFLQVEVRDATGILSLDWKCQELLAYRPMKRRVNGQLGWAELCDTRLLPNWSTAKKDRSADEHAAWVPVRHTAPWKGETPPDYQASTLERCHHLIQPAKVINSGTYLNRFGYEMDDPPVRFYLRDLQPVHSPDGVWFRFDLGKVGLYRPVFTLEVPAGTVVEAAYSEYLTDNRVAPFITLSASSSCHMDRWILRGGRQEFRTFSERGFRYVEVHIAARHDQVLLHECYGRQRTYFAAPSGQFTSSDPLLNEIWNLGVDTLQACSEDALTDTPTRERGQWLGDAVAVGVETLSVAYGDLKLIRRSLEQAALCRQKDGMIAGCYPGQIIPVSSFAMLWVSGCMRYYRLSGDKAFIEAHFEQANDVIDLYLSYMSKSGIVHFPYWDFVDWGHIISKNDVNIALNVLTWKALVDLADWATELGEPEQHDVRVEQYDQLEQIIRQKMMNADGMLLASIAPDSDTAITSLQEPGYHANVLALRFGLFRGTERAPVVEFMKNHISNCFPNREDAPRLSHPAANSHQLITPYFGHYALAALLDEGETDFVLQQFRTCWGWMLDQGATTLLEVFDHRWSHCHAWSGCPTWQLSRYLLGLHATAADDGYSFLFQLHPGSLAHASGTLPLVDRDEVIRVAWHRTPDGILYTCESDREIIVTISDELSCHIHLIEQEKRSLSTGTFRTRGFQAYLKE